ncbi:MAG TPA: MgtC/SapB family protein [Longimicrobiaceae bacterium]|nr:MgtC/SapB family protein [Longimicrobiaceae bacterium]
MTDFFLALGFSPELVAALRLDTFGRLLLAALLGGLIGMEREVSNKPAGLRTNLLLCVGAALLTELSLLVAELPGEPRGDPGRIAAQIIPGIGFIGAGAILHARGRVTGLTTAATIWVVVAIGMAVGMGAYTEAAGTTALVLVTLFLLHRVEGWLRGRYTARRYRVSVEAGPDAIAHLEEDCREAGLRVRIESVEKHPGTLEVTVRVVGASSALDEALRRLAADPDVRALARV